MDGMKATEKLEQYGLMVFDCDGVILDSNVIRADAFYHAALPYGERYAEQLRAYHIVHGGVSRYAKFDIFLRDMVGIDVTEARRRELLQRFTDAVKQGLMHCEVAPGLAVLRERTPHADWMVVSGADQDELRQVFSARGMADWFNLGIFGSPRNKDAILAEEMPSPGQRGAGIFFGDSRYDHEAALRAGLDFMFVSGWTDFSGWDRYCREHGVATVPGLGDLV